MLLGVIARESFGRLRINSTTKQSLEKSEIASLGSGGSDQEGGSQGTGTFAMTWKEGRQG